VPKLVRPHEMHFLALSTQVLQFPSQRRHLKLVALEYVPFSQVSEHTVVP